MDYDASKYDDSDEELCLDENERELFEAYNAAGSDSVDEEEYRNISSRGSRSEEYFLKESSGKEGTSVETSSGLNLPTSEAQHFSQLDEDCWNPRYPDGFTINGGSSDEDEDNLVKFRQKFKQNVIQQSRDPNSNAGFILIGEAEEDQSNAPSGHTADYRASRSSLHYDSDNHDVTQSTARKNNVSTQGANTAEGESGHLTVSEGKRIWEERAQRLSDSSNISRRMPQQEQQSRQLHASTNQDLVPSAETTPQRPVRKTRARTPQEEDAKHPISRTEQRPTAHMSTTTTGGRGSADGKKKRDGTSLSSVWSNLRAIFADIDAGTSAVQSPALESPLARLRHLLDLHTQLEEEEHELTKSHLGLLVEAGWHLEKLRQIEEMVSKKHEIEMSVEQEMGLEPSNVAPSLATRLRSELCKEAPGFKLLSKYKGKS